MAQRVASLERDLDTAVRDRDAALAHVDILSTHVADNTAVDTRILAQVDETIKKVHQQAHANAPAIALSCSHTHAHTLTHLFAYHVCFVCSGNTCWVTKMLRLLHSGR